MVSKDLGNAAFFATKKLAKDIEQLRLELEETKKQIRESNILRPLEVQD